MIDPMNPGAVFITGLEVLYGLTAAEAQVCRLLIDGLSYGDIADTRGVTLETIKSQAKSILAKTGVSSRSALVRLALRINLPVD
ncbi:MAG: helix-turn-helix transcriptional regulator [Pseudomonadota bacterium]